MEYTLLNVLVLELKIYCDPDKSYERPKFGQYDEVKNRAPLYSDTVSRRLFQPIWRNLYIDMGISQISFLAIVV